MDVEITPNPEQPDKKGPEGANSDDFGAALDQAFGADLREIMAQVSQRLNRNMEVNTDTLEGQLREGLIENRAKELEQRYSSPAYVARMMGLISGGVQVLEKREPEENKPDIHIKDIGALDPEDIQELFDGRETIEVAVGPSEDDIKQMLAGLLGSSEMAAISARQAAQREYMTTDEVLALRTESLETLQNAGMATGAIEKIAEERNEALSAYKEFQKKVFAKLLALAESEGLDAALKPEARKQIIRGMMSREDYLEMRMQELASVGESMNHLEEIGRVDGGDTGQMVEMAMAALTDDGQLERLESRIMYEITADARLIYTD
jgi:hypothetical protein